MSTEGDDVFRHRADAIIDALVGGRGFDDIPPVLDDDMSAPVELVAVDVLAAEDSVVQDAGDDDFAGSSSDTAAGTGDAGWLPPVPPTQADDDHRDDDESADPSGGADRSDSPATALSDQGADDMSHTTDTIASLLRGDHPADTTPGFANDDTARTSDNPASADAVDHDFFDATPPAAEEDRIPVGTLPPVHDDRDNYRYNPNESASASDTDSGAESGDIEDSARFDTPAAHESTWDRGRRLMSEHGSRKATIIVAAATLVVILVIGLLVITLRGSGDDEGQVTVATNTPAIQPSRPAQDTTDADEDAQIPIGDVTSRCPAGSTNPKLAFDNQMSTAWVCVRSFGLDGQVLRVRLQGAYVISSIGIVPGFNAPTSDGKDQWGKHRTVTRVKYSFNDADRTVYNQTTNNVRNEVVTRINPPVLASSVTITILQTAAPTSDPDTSEAPRGGDGARTELDDFAVSSITVNGHRPS